MSESDKIETQAEGEEAKRERCFQEFSTSAAQAGHDLDWYWGQLSMARATSTPDNVLRLEGKYAEAEERLAKAQMAKNKAAEERADAARMLNETKWKATKAKERLQNRLYEREAARKAVEDKD